ncbi:MAG: alpha/beta hydrolase, partial [Nocardioidaceae bacterium]
GDHTPTTAPSTRLTTPTPTTSSVPTPSSGQTSGPAQVSSDYGAGPPGHGLQRFYTQHVTWSGCGGGDQCASIWVPLDYHHPDGRAITIKAKRQPARDQAKKVGSLFINPGGPGGSGIDYLSYVGFPTSVTDIYDVIGFDPRGVGESTPIECVSNRAMDTYLASNPSPDTPAEIAQFKRQWKQFTSGCVQNSGALLDHVSTVETAKDLDILRAVVKDPKLNYFGASYGTYLGTTYAALFPTHVRRMVLDGAVDPLALPRTTEIDQAAGFQTALTAYLQYCVGRGNCPLGSSVGAAQTRLIQLLDDVGKHPLPTSSGRKLTAGLAFYGVILPLYSRDNWQYETTALTQALQGRGDVLLALADAYASRLPNGTYKDNSLQVQSAVNCLDHPEHESVADILRGRKAFLKASPVFGATAMWWPYSCSNWPVKPTWPHPSYAAKGAPPIIVIGTTRDPATPYQQAVNLARDLSSGVLLTRNGDGHTAYASGNVCIDTTVDNYFTRDLVPPNGKRC